MNAYVFPGQGSQKKGMGESLFDEFADLTKKADEILGYSIKELCVIDPDQKLNQTQYTQPALYTVNALTYMKKIQTTGKKPDFFAGHSLGEYNALFAAGMFSFETGLNLVKKRGELMSKAMNGAMAAIINCSEENIRKILNDANLTTIDIANYNAPSQIIISGLKDDIVKSQTFFEKSNARFVPLNTSGAFHSRYMKDAATKYEKIVKKCEFFKPDVMVIANVSAKPYQFEQIAQNLIEQIYNSVKWTDTVKYLLEQGVTEFEEIGVGDVLTKLIVSIKKDWTPSLKKESEVQTELPSNLKNEKIDNVGDVKKDDASKLLQGRNEATKAIDAKELVDQWNSKYPVGTKVISQHYEKELETRTEAMILFGHRAAVYMKDYNGYFDLREVAPVK